MYRVVGVPIQKLMASLSAWLREMSTGSSVVLALVLVLGYYLVTVVVKWLDHHPEFRPDLLLCLPNVLFIGLGLWLNIAPPASPQ